MPFPSYKMALNAVTGQKSAAVYTSNLVGNWDPSLGINAGYWENQVDGGNNLRRFNGITHNNSTPHNWQFDGSDDYLGEAAGGGYGGTPFSFNVENAWTVAMWIKYNNVSGHPFYLHADGDNYIDCRINPTGGEADRLTLGVHDANDVWNEWHTFPFVFSDDTWYYIAVVYDGGANFKLYINGNFDNSMTNDNMGTFDMGSENIMKLQIGNSQENYVGAGHKVGHVHVYTAELTNSQIRQNFLATHKMNSDRIYGNTFQA